VLYDRERKRKREREREGKRENNKPVTLFPAFSQEE